MYKHQGFFQGVLETRFGSQNWKSGP